MQRYKNLSGDSGVYAYEVGTDHIKVQFRNGHIYLYTDDVTGFVNVGKMKALAIAGRGLNTFINTSVRKKYAKRIL